MIEPTLQQIVTWPKNATPSTLTATDIHVAAVAQSLIDLHEHVDRVGGGMLIEFSRISKRFEAIEDRLSPPSLSVEEASHPPQDPAAGLPWYTEENERLKRELEAANRWADARERERDQARADIERMKEEFNHEIGERHAVSALQAQLAEAQAEEQRWHARAVTAEARATRYSIAVDQVTLVLAGIDVEDVPF